MKQNKIQKQRRQVFLFTALILLILALVVSSNGRVFAAVGLEVSGDGLYVSSDTDIVMTGENNDGVVAKDGRTASLDANVTMDGDNSKGAYAFNSGNIEITGSVLAEGKDVYGLHLLNGSSADVNGSVSVSGDRSKGVLVSGDSAINTIGGVIAEGMEARGVMSVSKSKAGISGDVSVSGNKSAGARASDSAAVDVSGSVSAEGDNAYGLRVTDSSKGNVSLNVSASGDHPTGVLAFGDSNIHVNGSVAVVGFGAKGLNIRNNSGVIISGAVSASGDSSISALASGNSKIDISGNVSASGNNSLGLYSLNKADISVKNKKVTVLGGTAFRVDFEGNINLDNTLVSGDTFSLLKSESWGNISAANGSRLFGDVTNSNSDYADSPLNINLSGSSGLEGALTDSGAYALTNLSLGGADDAWYVTGDSMINGTLTNNGLVDYTKAGSNTTVTVGNLSGGGTFAMKSDIVSGTSDKLVIKGTTDGSHKIRVHNSGSAATTGNERLTLIETADQNGSFALTNDVELGAWVYSLRPVTTGAGTAWELYGANGTGTSAGGSIAGQDAGTGTSTGGTYVPRVSSTASAAVNTFAGSYLLGYTETHTLIQRLGDLRETSNLSGLWFRVHGGKFEAGAGTFAKGFDMDYRGVQLGYDRKINTGWNGELYAGTMFGYAKGDLSYTDRSSGEVESKMLGAYGTYMAGNGFYADLVLKYQWMDNEFKVRDSAGAAVTGNGVTTGGFGASAEIGRRLRFDKEKTHGWYIEPQTQLSCMRYSGDYYAASNGLSIGADSFTSLIGRAGFLLGYETETSNFYAKISRVKEFNGDVTILANSQELTESFGGIWWAYGIGYTSRINYRNSFYADIERSSGGTFTQNWAVKAGWRVLF